MSVGGKKDWVFLAVACAAVIAAIAAYGIGTTHGGQRAYVDLPSNHGHTLDDALRRLHAVGLRASFPAASIRCGNDLPWVNVQSPSAPARVLRNTDVKLSLGPLPSPTPSAPINRPQWTYVPDLVGKEAPAAFAQLREAIWPCVHVRAAQATSASRLVVVKQSLAPGTRVPAYGVKVGGGWRPTTVNVEVEAKE